ncbi:adenine phosphoribosyltransferase 1-like [Aristolochia californica]|uniref:adenine phosphoribosyltransferase 1-like n=1 Tax=Aristolochia californica TaxID=171875 RepID=UPI0035DE3F3B
MILGVACFSPHRRLLAATALADQWSIDEWLQFGRRDPRIGTKSFTARSKISIHDSEYSFSLAVSGNRRVHRIGRETRPLEVGGKRKALLSGSSVCTARKMGTQEGDDRLAKIASSIRAIPDFPKPGILFQDITTLLLDPKAFRDTIDLFVERYRDKNISVVAGIEARGFIFGPPIALAIGAKFVPMRKPKKLPGEVISEEYSLEYGTDKMEMHVGAVEAGERALVIDDLIATGGTLCAAIRLLERVGVEVVECACLIELPELKGRDRLGDKPLFVLIRAA